MPVSLGIATSRCSFLLRNSSIFGRTNVLLTQKRILPLTLNNHVNKVICNFPTISTTPLNLTDDRGDNLIESIIYKNNLSAAKRRYFKDDEDQFILDYVKKYGGGNEIWDRLANHLNRKSGIIVQRRHDQLIKNKKSERKRYFTPKEDQMILEYVEKHGTASQSWKELAVILDRVWPQNIKCRLAWLLNDQTKYRYAFTADEDKMILRRVEEKGNNSETWKELCIELNLLETNIERRIEILLVNPFGARRKWTLLDEQQLLEILFKGSSSNMDSIAKLRSVRIKDMELVAQKLKRTRHACYQHWEGVLLPILKSHLLDLSLNNEWKQDFLRYIVDKKNNDINRD